MVRATAALCLAVSAMLCVRCAGAAEELTDAQLEAMLAKPAATGLIVLGVADGSQAQAKGIRRGDIITSYNGDALRDLDTLRAAITKANEAKVQKIRLTASRDGAEVALEIAPGPLGVNSVPVEKGVTLHARPPATGVAFDFAGLKEPLDAWFDFRMDGKKVGFEHYVLKKADDKLVLESEVAFDGGAQFGGPQHFLVTLTATAEARPKMLKLSYAMPLAKYLCEGERSVAGKTAWTYRASWVEKSEDGKETPKSHDETVPAPDDLLSDYLLVPIAPFMPRKQGECFHFTNLNAGTGDVAAPTGLFIAAQEDADVGGTKVKAWRVEQYAWGQIARTTYVSDDGRVVKNIYGPGVESILTDKLKALDGLPAGIKPASR